jgi:hypothetical protein
VACKMADGQKRGRGRPPILEPDDKTLSQLRNLRLIQSTIEEAAAVFGVHRSTLHEFLVRHPEAREAWENGKHEGRASLRVSSSRLPKRIQRWRSSWASNIWVSGTGESWQARMVVRLQSISMCPGSPTNNWSSWNPSWSRL